MLCLATISSAAHLQTVGAGNAAEVASIQATLTVGTTGNALIVSTGKYYPDVWAVTSNNANCATFVHAIGPVAASGGTNQFASQWYCLNAAAGSTTVTFAYVSDGDGDNFVELVVSEFDGVLTSGAFDVSTSQVQAGTTAPSSGVTGTRTQAAELLVGTVALVGTPTVSAGTNVAYVIPTNGTQTSASGSNVKTSQEYFIASSAGTDAATFSLSSSSDTATLIGTYKLISSAAPRRNRIWIQ